jgi:transposase
MTRAGNRQLNTALHRIALTQIRLPSSAGRVYFQKKKIEGMSTPEALRCLKRRLARTVFGHLAADQQVRTARVDRPIHGHDLLVAAASGRC